MNLQLVNENDPILRLTAKSWDFETDGDPSDIVRDMARIMIESNGIGLAGPQVGLSKRIFVMGNKDKLYACINPEIIEAEGNVIDQEGCLSFPELWLRVRRADIIKVKYQNALGGTIEAEFSGLISRVYQHESDHLNGVCFDTRVGKLSLEMANRRKKKRLKKSLY